MRDLDDAFNNMGHVEGSDALPGFWAARAAAYRKGGRCGSTAMFHMATASGKYLIWSGQIRRPLPWGLWRCIVSPAWFPWGLPTAMTRELRLVVDRWPIHPLLIM